MDNRLCGTTCVGGTNASGTVFSLNVDGSDFRVLHTFELNGYVGNGRARNPDGFYSTAGLVSLDGMLYGTTSAGGTNGTGVLFALSIAGSSFSVLHTFSTHGLTDPDGAWPNGLVISGHTLYGTTAQEGPGSYGTIFAFDTDSTVFTVLHGLVSQEGGISLASLTVLGDRLYGTTSQHGLHGGGTVFSLSTDGSDFRVLYNFSAKASNGTNADGAYMVSSMVLAGDALFGAAEQGGSQGYGTVFALQLPVLISSVFRNPQSGTILHFTGTPFMNYAVQAATTLSSGSTWQIIGTNTAGASGSWQFIDVDSSNYPSRFYRSYPLR
jgi:uncharacterized repeat protein (TIGR03803 family)